MKEFGYNRTSGTDPSIYPALLIMAGTVFVAFFILLYTTGGLDSYPKAHFIPWTLGLLAVFAAPNVYLYLKGNFSFADPIVFATYSYFAPAFFFGGIFFALDLSQPYFIYMIQDQDVTIPLTLFLVALGFSGLAIGYFLPLGRKAGSMIAGKLPKFEHKDESLIIPGIVLLLIGIMNTGFALVVGVFGYQRTEEVGVFDALINMTTILWVQATFLLFLIVFRRAKVDVTTISILSILLVVNIVRLLFGGSRGSLLPILAAGVIAFALSGRKFSLKQIVITILAFMLIVVGGMIYGTNFRNIKGDESQQDVGQYTENVLRTIDQVGQTDVTGTIGTGLVNLAERLDVVSTLAVVVSRHEQLAPYEEAYALDDNIVKDTITSIIPRFIWTTKPPLSDPRRYSELYFDYGENSFAITPMGDLLRNYGLIGVFLGMALIGLCLRFISAALIEGQPPSIWRMTLFFMLLTSVSYESFYGFIIPIFFKAGIVSVIGIVIVSFLASRIESAKARSAREMQVSV